MVLYRQAPRLAADYLQRYAEEQTARVMERWRRLWQELFVKYLDGNVRDEKGAVTHPPYPADWYRRIVQESGRFYRVRHYQPPEKPEPPAPEPNYLFCPFCPHRPAR